MTVPAVIGMRASVVYFVARHLGKLAIDLRNDLVDGRALAPLLPELFEDLGDVDRLAARCHAARFHRGEVDEQLDDAL